MVIVPARPSERVSGRTATRLFSIFHLSESLSERKIGSPLIDGVRPKVQLVSLIGDEDRVVILGSLFPRVPEIKKSRPHDY